MVKKGLLFFLFVCICYANISTPLQNKVINLIDKEDYKTHKDFINILLRDEDKFLTNSKINVIKIIKVLQDNGLFKFIFKNPIDMSLAFEAKSRDNVLLTIKSIQDALHSVGYGFFITTQAQYSNILKWSISFKTNVGIDPLLLDVELRKRGIIIEDIIKHKKTRWTYKLNTKNVRLSGVHKLKKEQAVTIKERANSIFIQPIGINGYSNIIITSNPKNTWYPYIVFYDKQLNILKMKKVDKIIKRIKTRIPLGSHYIKLSDIYISKNFNNGFTILIE